MGANTPDVVMYSTSWCGYCRRLGSQMQEAGISYRVIDLDGDPSYDERIKQASGGYRTVPTLEIGDDLLVNPTINEVKAALIS